MPMQGKVIEVYREGADRIGLVEFAGKRRAIHLTLIPDVKAGDEVLFHAGFATERLPRQENEPAEKTAPTHRVNLETGGAYRLLNELDPQQLRKLIPLAEELKIVIALEEVWNKFLLSPIEFAKYTDEFASPWVKVWFDVGNIVFYGYPQDWIRTLGNRICELHLKDFKRRDDGYSWVNLGDGDIDWAEVHKALAEIGYSGTATTEIEGGDEAYLRDVSKRIDRLVIGA